MARANLGVTYCGTPYDRTDGLEIRLTTAEITAILRACVSAMDGDAGGPDESDDDFEVALCKLSDAARVDWCDVPSWDSEKSPRSARRP